jgi:hypothetical protein
MMEFLAGCGIIALWFVVMLGFWLHKVAVSLSRRKGGQ